MGFRRARRDGIRRTVRNLPDARGERQYMNDIGYWSIVFWPWPCLHLIFFRVIVDDAFLFASASCRPEELGRGTIGVLTQSSR
jgi:hypothetical protein